MILQGEIVNRTKVGMLTTQDDVGGMRSRPLQTTDAGRQDYASISGRGEIVRDRAKMQALWSPWVKVWFPEGLDDPDLALLCVHAEQAEYWDSPGSSVRRLYALVKARATGDKDAIGENRKLRAG